LVGVLLGVTSLRRPDDRPDVLEMLPEALESLGEEKLLSCGLRGNPALLDPLRGAEEFRYMLAWLGIGIEAGSTVPTEL
jgi:hypothetical protein